MIHHYWARHAQIAKGQRLITLGQVIILASVLILVFLTGLWSAQYISARQKPMATTSDSYQPDSSHKYENGHWWILSPDGQWTHDPACARNDALGINPPDQR